MKVVLIVLVLPNCTREQTTGDILCVQPEEIESFGVIDRPLSMEWLKSILTLAQATDGSTAANIY